MADWKWFAVALLAYVLSIADGVLTLHIGFESNPLLSRAFETWPQSLFLLKVLLGPLFWMLALAAYRTRLKLPRSALIFILGWYSSTVCIQLMQLAGT